MRKRTLIPGPIALMFAVAACAPAAETGDTEAGRGTAAQETAEASVPTTRSELLSDLSNLRGKYVGLADAIPESGYGWRPADGVRSVSEVYMHVVTANIGIVSGALVAAVPEGVDPAWYGQDAEAITDKATVVEALGASFDYIAEVIEGTSDERMAEVVSMFGRSQSIRGVLTFTLAHCHEHLGQSIAYARVNGVVPPWSM